MSDILRRQQQQQIDIAQLEARKRQQQQPGQQQLEQQEEQGNLAQQQQYYREKDKFESENVKLGTGEWVAKSEYNKLDSLEQEQLSRLGIDKFQTYQKQQADQQLAELQRNYTQLGSGEWIEKTYYNDLPREWQQQLAARGVSGWKSWWESKPYGGSSDFVIGELYGQPTVFGKTSDSLIGIDASGMRVYLGDTWPEHIIRYTGNPNTSPGYKQAQGLPLTPAGVTLPAILASRDKIKEQIQSGELVQTAKSELIDKDLFNKLNKEDQDVLKEHGLEALKTKQQYDQRKVAEMALSKSVAPTVAKAKLPEGAQFIRELPDGSIEYSIPDTRSAVEVFAELKKKGEVPESAIMRSAVKTGNEWQFQYQEVAAPKSGYADLAVDYDTGKLYDVSNPNKPREITVPTADIKKIAKQQGIDWGNVPAFAMGAGAVALAEPTPIGEAIWILGMIGAVSSTLAMNERNREAIKDYVVTGVQWLADNDKKVHELINSTFSISKTGTIEPITLEPVKPNIETFPLEKEKATIETFPLEQPAINQETFPLEKEETLTLTFPLLQPKKGDNIILDPDITVVKNAKDLIMMSVAYTATQEKLLDLSRVHTSSKTMPLTDAEWRKVMSALDDKGQTAVQTADELNKAISIVEAAKSRIQIGVSENDIDDFRKSLEDLQIKRALLENAKRTYINSLNPTPVNKQPLNEAQIAAVAAIILANAKGIAIPKHINAENFDSYLKQVSANVPLTKGTAKTAVETEAQADAVAQAQTQTQTKAQVKTITATQVQTRTATKTQTATRTAVKTAVRTATRTATRSVPISRTATATRTATRTRSPSRPPIIPPMLPPDEKLEKLTKEQRKGIIGWKQGFMYKIIYPPYEQVDVINSADPLPGIQYHTGLGSAVKSLVAMRGEIPQHIARDMGIVDINFFRTRNPRKPKMIFTPDKEQQTMQGVAKSR